MKANDFPPPQQKPVTAIFLVSANGWAASHFSDAAVSEVTRAVMHDHWKQRAATVLINGTLRATVNHPFFVNGRWQRADQLKVGDVLVRALPAGKEATQAR